MTLAISRYGTRVVPNTQHIVADLERRGELVEGPHLMAFTDAFSARVGGLRTIPASYGRMAFYYILQALRFPLGSEIVMPSLTFWVVPEMARVAGLRPVFVDVDPVTFDMTVDGFERAIGAKTVAVVPTHLWGLPCDMDEIVAVAHRHGIVVIEDCAHALGSTYHDRPAGTLGDAAFFSLQTIKPLNTYGGGMAVVRDPDVARRVADIANAAPLPDVRMVKRKLWQGRVQRVVTQPHVFTWTMFPLVYGCRRLNRSFDAYFWEKIRPLDPLPPGYHVRYSNVQAAIGLEGLELLDRWHATTCRHAARMFSILRQVPGVRLPIVPPDRAHTFYQYSVYVPERDAVVHRCLQHGVDIETLHVDVCTSLPLFAGPHAPMPGAALTTRTIQIPVYESLTDEELARVGAVVKDAVLSLKAVGTPAMRESSS